MSAPEMRTTHLTQTRETQSFYRRVVARLERHAAKLLAAGDMAEIPDRNVRVAIAYACLEPTVTEATARLYRAAILHLIEAEPGERDWDVLKIIDPEPSASESDRQDELRARRAQNLQTLRGAQQKAKWLSMADWTKLGEALGRSRSSWARPARHWITATLLTGLRPCEWRRAMLDGASLVVVNAKATNGRAHSQTRTIGLAKCDRTELAVVASFLDLVRSFGSDGYKTLYDGVRDLICDVARETFPGRDRYPSLYTARHCFAARAKATYSKVEVAALMGHASTATAGRNYAPARHARGGRPLEAEPSANDIDAVRRAQNARSLFSEPKDMP
jgi:hypothetical protein